MERLGKARHGLPQALSHLETVRQSAGVTSWFPPYLKFLWCEMWECAMKPFRLGGKTRVGSLWGRSVSAPHPGTALHACPLHQEHPESLASPSPFSHVVFVVFVVVGLDGPLLSQLGFRTSLSVPILTHTQSLLDLVWGKIDAFLIWRLPPAIQIYPPIYLGLLKFPLNNTL